MADDVQTKMDRLMGKEPFVDVVEDGFISKEDVPEFYLKGTVPGATSSELAEDPNFSIISDGQQPGARYWSDERRLKRQAACDGRYEFDAQFRGIIDGFLVFVIGRGFKVNPVDEADQVKAFIDEFIKVNQFNGRDREIVLKFLKTGEVFVRFFKTNIGKPARIPVIRLLNYHEITEIELDLNDRETPKAFIRKYRSQDEQKEERIPADEILHIKFGERDQKRGNPPFCTISQASQWYMDWLKNRTVFNRLKTSYYLEEIVDGSPSRVTTQDNQATDQNRTSKTGQLIKRMPKFGSKLVHNKAVEYKWLKPDIGADDAKEDGRAIRLSICAGAQCPEFLLGDAANANFSSTLVSQNPFVRKVEFLQDYLQPFFAAIFEKVIQHGIDGGFIKKKSTETIAFEKAGWFKKIMLKAKGIVMSENVERTVLGTILTEQLDQAGNAVKKKVVPTKTEVTIQWPTLIVQDILKDSQALQIHQGMGIVSNRTLAYRFGYDYEEEIRRLEAEREEGIEGEVPDDELAGKKRRDATKPEPDDEDE